MNIAGAPYLYTVLMRPSAEVAVVSRVSPALAVELKISLPIEIGPFRPLE